MQRAEHPTFAAAASKTETSSMTKKLLKPLQADWEISNCGSKD